MWEVVWTTRDCPVAYFGHDDERGARRFARLLEGNPNTVSVEVTHRPGVRRGRLPDTGEDSGRRPGGGGLGRASRTSRARRVAAATRSTSARTPSRVTGPPSASSCRATRATAATASPGRNEAIASTTAGGRSQRMRRCSGWRGRSGYCIGASPAGDSAPTVNRPAAGGEARPARKGPRPREFPGKNAERTVNCVPTRRHWHHRQGRETMPQHKKQKVRFTDGRRGYQYVTVHDNGDVELTGLVITRTAEGRPCKVVYDKHDDIQARVYSLYRIQGEWELDE
jgi:hypothetical protein